MLIDCDACTARGSGCGGCVVPLILGLPAGRGVTHEPLGTVDLDDAERAAIGVLARSGLVPPLRLRPTSAGSGEADATAGPGDGGLLARGA